MVVCAAVVGAGHWEMIRHVAATEMRIDGREELGLCDDHVNARV